MIHIKNGGTGGQLGWRAKSNRELSISPSSGKLAVNRTVTLKIKVRSRTGRENPAVIVKGKGGGGLTGRATRGRVMIYFKVR